MRFRTRTRTFAPWGNLLGSLLLTLACLWPQTTLALTNSASGTFNGVAFDTTQATVTLIRDTGNAVDSALGEINPGSVLAATPVNFRLVIEPTFGAGSSGFDRVEMIAPGGYNGINATSVLLDGTPLPLATCAVPASGSVCQQVAGTTLTLLFGDTISGSTNRLAIDFSATSPAAAGTGSFSATLDLAASPALPQDILSGDADNDPANNNSLDVGVSTTIDPGGSSFVADPQVVIADGSTTSNLIATLIGPDGLPVSGRNLTYTSDRAADLLVQPPATGGNGVTSGTIASNEVGVATVTATDSDGTSILERAQVYFTQGDVLELDKSVNRDEVLIGETVTYTIAVRNRTARDIVQVHLDDQLPPNFVYRAGSARINGNPIADPPGVRRLSFDLGTLPARVDANGNGKADPGEDGYLELSYQLIVSAGATPGTYSNRAWAYDVCDSCFISNETSANVEVALDPLFDLGTIIGKVFEDHDGDGWQDAGEKGIPGAMVVLDEGTYALTDPYGRYHFPAVAPGERLVKINLLGLGNGATATGGEAQVASITPGLLAKINFGVSYRYEESSIGKPEEYGVEVATSGGTRPIEVHGSVENHLLLLNGQQVALPGNDVRLQFNSLEEVVTLDGGQLQQPVRFGVLTRGDIAPESWTLRIYDSNRAQVQKLSGEGEPPQPLEWDGILANGSQIAGGEVYQYQLESLYPDGTRMFSARRLFGVDQVSAISMSLTGSAFVIGSAELGPPAREALTEAAQILRQHPQEVVVIEGHSDAQGNAAFNLKLSQERADAARDYLVEIEELSRDRFVTIGYGETRPLASNRLPEGRELNRRIEIKGEYLEVERARLLDQYHTPVMVMINGQPEETVGDGRFHARVEAEDGVVEIAMNDRQGSSVSTTLDVPRCEIEHPRGTTVVPFENLQCGYQTGPDAPKTDKPLVRTHLQGRTDAGNRIWLGDKELTVGHDGRFEAPLELKRGSNHVSLLIENAAGFTRLAGLRVHIADRDSDGGHILYAEEVPFLSVRIPPSDKPLDSNVFLISGRTERQNRVFINDKPVTVGTDGHFTSSLNLPQGTSPLKIEVVDSQGRRGAIERELTISDTRLFFLAFADGKVSQLETSGNLDNAGRGERSEVVTEGRLALYLKGTIAGRYLLTAAFDTGRGEFDTLFEDLDATEHDRLLTNLDPDRLYPVYGDTSTLVYDTESQGKLYLALESDELQLLLGNYQLELNGGELATYKRTLYGGHTVYRSPDTTRYGAPYSEVEAFVAEVRQVHIRDELAATGGSLYYLSHDDVIEGSEQVELVVRDKLTGLQLARIPQQQNIDYTVKYPEGRLLFKLPVASTRLDERLVDQALLSGNPVTIRVDYEAEVEAFENTGGGGCIRQQLGEHVALGATAIQDDTGAGSYELWGIDSEIRLGEATRILAEYAESRGSEASVYVSHDGGLNFETVTESDFDSGAAWKLAAELDLDSWLGKPEALNVGFYLKQLDPGYEASGHQGERGTRKGGAHLRLKLTGHQSLRMRYDVTEYELALPDTPESSDTGILQWHYHQERWRLICEYLWQSADSTAPAHTDNDQYAAIRLSGELLAGLTTWAEHQQTLDGVENNQTSVGLDYRLFDLVSLHVSASDGTLGRAAEGGVSLDNRAGRLYLTQRLSEDRAERSRATILGGRTDKGPLGTTLYSEYQWKQDSRNDSNLSLVGVERHWELAPGLSLFAGGEFSELDSDDTRRRYTLSSGLRYNRNQQLTFSSRNELRRETGTLETTQTLTVNRGELRLSQDFTLLGLYRYSHTEERETSQEIAGFEEISIGLAYRPVAFDTFNALARATRLGDRRPPDSSDSEPIERKLESLALEWSMQLHPRIEWVEKQALRRLQEHDPIQAPYESVAWLSLHRVNLNAWKKFDLGFEYRTLDEDASNSRRSGWLTELSWQAQRHMRFGVGYNFTDFSDDERSLNDYSVRGWFLRAQGMY